MMTSSDPGAEPNNVTTLPAAIDGIMMDTAQIIWQYMSQSNKYLHLNKVEK